MYKTKTKKIAAKRIKITKGKKLMHRSILMNHKKNAKSASRVRRMQEPKQVTGAIEKTTKKLMPYSAY